MKISQSRVKLRRRCAAAHGYKYYDHLRKKVKSRSLKVGSIIHDMLEAHANGDDPFGVLNTINLDERKLFEAEREMYGDIINDIRYIMTDYFAFWKGRDITYLRKNGKNAEHSFELELEKDLIIVGRIDGIAKPRKSPLKFVLEHKTFKRTPSEDSRWRNVQSAIYLRIVEMLDWGHFDGMIWDYIGNRPPAEPEILKSGKLSHRSITTTPSALAAFLKRNNLSTIHHKELIDEVKGRQDEYFFRVQRPIKPDVVDSVFNDFVSTARTIIEEDGRNRVRSIDPFHCAMCDYEPLCRAELQGLDVDFVKEREYYVEKKDDDPSVIASEGE